MDSATQLIERQTMESIASLQIPMQNQMLLVPTVTVAEMVPYSQPQAVAGAPEWLLGSFTWRNTEVPLLAFEVLNGAPAPVPGETSRIAVFNNTGVSDELPFIALLTSGIPRLLRIVEGDLQLLAEGEPGSVARVLVGFEDNPMIIPDLTVLEQRYIDWRNGY
ncbi:chemotaxis protein CheW [Pseudomaricurvus sp. HS19]|uniref:chemotaxis protein CheW n=1 Tax=Pseudomaricurvus sp. HS19 TaxID=2692626 RepID=UPI00136A45FB|nr:chemotaxis protein CheW [Pseudomaricurvus sp. HS19]MYM63660.1 chemotaxis protein CheW [Pseudomaricurvus sp. HS19]